MSEKKEQSDELLYEKGKLLTSYFPPITPPKKLGCERDRITCIYKSQFSILLYVYICVPVRSFGRNHIHYIVACETASHAC